MTWTIDWLKEWMLSMAGIDDVYSPRVAAEITLETIYRIEGYKKYDRLSSLKEYVKFNLS